MSKESTFGMKSQRAVGGGRQVWNSLWNGFVRRQVKEIRVAAAVIPALKDKSIERDFRTLK